MDKFILKNCLAFSVDTFFHKRQYESFQLLSKVKEEGTSILQTCWLCLQQPKVNKWLSHPYINLGILYVFACLNFFLSFANPATTISDPLIDLAWWLYSIWLLVSVNFFHNWNLNSQTLKNCDILIVVSKAFKKKLNDALVQSSFHTTWASLFEMELESNSLDWKGN